jgi:hypothetical protein
MASTYSTVDPILWAAASGGSCAPGFVLLHACRSPVREVRDARRAGLSQRASTAGLADGDEEVRRDARVETRIRDRARIGGGCGAVTACLRYRSRAKGLARMAGLLLSW